MLSTLIALYYYIQILLIIYLNVCRQVAHELDDEEAWLREKLLLASSTDYGRDLPSTQNLRKRHRRLEAELSAHEPIIENLNGVVDRLAELQHDDAELERLRQRCRDLVDGWRQLTVLVEARGRRLDENVAYFKWLALIGEEMAWLEQNAPLVIEDDRARPMDCGETLSQAQGWIKKHEAFETDLGVHKERVHSLVKNVYIDK